MIFRQLFDTESFTYTYLLGDEISREAVLIDPVKERVDEYLGLLKVLGLKLKYVLDTHVHADHVTGAGELRERTGAETALFETTRAQCVSLKLKEGEGLKFGSYAIRVIHTPGHTPDSASFLVGDRLFTGDALFINGCGRTDFQGGSAEALWDAVTKKLFTLPPDTLVYPGHDYNKRRVSTIRQEMDLNPRFQVADREAFVKLMGGLNLPPPKRIHEAVPANERCGAAASKSPQEH